MTAFLSSSAFLSGLAGHVWQTTLFVAVVAGLTLALGKNRACVRHAMWFVASIKFAIPFSFLVAIGSAVGWPGTGPTPPNVAIVQVITGRAVMPLVEWPSGIVACLLGLIWLGGFTAVLLVWFQSWLRARRTIQSATAPVGELRNVLRSTREFTEVRTSTDMAAPGVFGLFRHVLLLPAEIGNGLNESELKSVIAHEAAHVKRRDNLTTTIHTIVTAMFWFHPFVWWIGQRLIDERERACDEATLAQGFAPNVFAEGLLKVCRSAVGTQLAVAGAHSSDLKTRVEGIMRYSQIRNVDGVLRFTIVALAIASVLGPVAVGLTSSPAIAQLRVSAQEMSERIIDQQPPRYPDEARRERIQGTVELDVLIDEEGVVRQVSALSGDPLLRLAAEDAVWQWVYDPYIIGGQPVEVLTTVNITFTLN